MVIMEPRSAAQMKQEPLSSHDRILAAAKQLFAARGYENASTVAIARSAGTSESQLIKHFGSKEGLLEAIFDHGWKQMEFVFMSVAQLPTPIEQMEALLNLILAAFERDPELRELMLLEGRRIRKEGHMVMLTGGYRRFIAVVDEVLARIKSSGQLRDDLNLQSVRSALVNMFEGLLRDQVLAKRMGFPANYDSEDLRRLFRIVLAGFLKPEAQALLREPA